MWGLGAAQNRKCWFFIGFNSVFWRVKRTTGVPGKVCDRASRGGSRSKKWCFWLKMLCGYIQNCASYVGGEYIFRKFMEQKLSEGEKWSRETLYGKCDGYMWGLGGAQKRKCWKKCWFLMHLLKGQRSKKDSMRTNSSPGSDRKSEIFDVKCLCLYLELCFLHVRGAHFQKSHEQNCQKVKNGAGRL